MTATVTSLRKNAEKSEEKMLAAAEKLGTLRRKTAKTFATKVKSEMAFLNMPNVELVPYFEKCEPNSKGTDKMELLISANPGETPRPVAKIASGGELSRMMLAIKTVLTTARIRLIPSFLMRLTQVFRVQRQKRSA